MKQILFILLGLILITACKQNTPKEEVAQVIEKPIGMLTFQGQEMDIVSLDSHTVTEYEVASLHEYIYNVGDSCILQIFLYGGDFGLFKYDQIEATLIKCLPNEEYEILFESIEHPDSFMFIPEMDRNQCEGAFWIGPDDDENNVAIVIMI